MGFIIILSSQLDHIYYFNFNNTITFFVLQHVMSNYMSMSIQVLQIIYTFLKTVSFTTVYILKLQQHRKYIYILLYVVKIL